MGEVGHEDGSDKELDGCEYNASETDEWVPHKHRKQLVKDRLVNYFDSCLDTNNCEEFNSPTETNGVHSRSRKS